MILPQQRIRAGRLEAAYRRQLEKLIAARAAEKIWSKQAELWTPDPAHASVIANRLGWIPVLDTMQRDAAALAAFAREARAAGLVNTVLLGMGGSSLAPEIFSLTFPAPAAGGQFVVLDSTDPGSVLDVEKTLDIRKALFIVASKSGKTIETLSQFEYFHARLVALGASAPGQQFIAITDPGSHLEQLAKQRAFRQTFLNPSDIGGRYSALSYFGLVPAALWGVDVASVLESAIAARAACGPDAPAANNPALTLGALLGSGAVEGMDKLVLLSTPALVPLSNWIEQLIAESTGKQNKGIVPVAGGAFPTPETLEKGCVVAALRLTGDSSAQLDGTLTAIAPRGVPIVEIELARAPDLGAEFFKWEVATAAAGAVLQIDPFDEPNVQESKDNTARILSEFEGGGKMPVSPAQLTDGGIELHLAAGQSAASGARLSDSLRAFFAQRKSNDYLSLLAYVERNAVNARELDAMRETISASLRLPVLLGYGPRYLHSIGQLYKGGPPTGLFLIITESKSRDAAIPGAKFTFAQLQTAQALGDMESLGQHHKPAARVHLTQGAAAGLTALRKTIEAALAAVRPAAQ
jgi:glucose-6-phosphate isomerase